MQNTPDNFRGGQLKLFLPEWQRITYDRWILNTILGYNIEMEVVPFQNCKPKPTMFSAYETALIDKEITQFLNKQIIEEVCLPAEGEYYSNIFSRFKKDGTVRIILNLKTFNDNVTKLHFKMETLKSALSTIQPGDWFGSLDLKDAYFSISVAKHHRKYLRFIWKDRQFQFCVLPQGLSSSPRVFTKVLKPMYATLRQQGHSNRDARYYRYTDKPGYDC